MTAQRLSPFHFRPERVPVGRAFVYEKSNVDGSNAGEIVQYVAAPDRVEAFKAWPGGSGATLVTAALDWARFSARELQSWQLRPGAEPRRVATLRQAGECAELAVSLDLGDGRLEQTLPIASYPWHSYDFDFASLNLMLPHLVDPLAPFTFAIADFNFDARAPAFVFKGDVTVEHQIDQDRHGWHCHRYGIDGPGLANRGGVLWADTSSMHIVDYEIDLPDEPGYESGKLRLKRVEHMRATDWHAFMAAGVNGI
jgi:hypothetical protein